MGGALNQAGLPRLPSLVFAALLVDDDGRMTAVELGAVLAVSPASVSTAVNYLARLAMIRRERVRGSRREVYVVDDDAWHGAMMTHDQLYAPMVAALEAGLRALDHGGAAHGRLRLTREFLLFVEQEMTGVAARWDTRRAQLQGDESDEATKGQ